MTKEVMVRNILIVGSNYLTKSLPESSEFSTYRFFCAGTATQVIELLQSYKFDTIFVNPNLRDDSAYPLVAIIASIMPTATILVQSGLKALPEDLPYNIQASTKPLVFNELITLLEGTCAYRKPEHIMPMFGFLKLLELDKQTGKLEVHQGSYVGTLHILSGTLMSAHLDLENGSHYDNEEAVAIMLSWHQPNLDFQHGYFGGDQKITGPLDSLLKRVKDALGFISQDQAISAEDQSLIISEQSTTTKPSLQNISEMENKMANVQKALDEALEIDGANAVALVDYESGMALGTAGSGINLEVAAAGNSEVIKAKMRVMKDLNLSDAIDDILISLGKQYHLIYLIEGQKGLFMYLVLSRERSNLAMARHKLASLSKDITI